MHQPSSTDQTVGSTTLFDLRQKPFYLSDAAVQWVEDTLKHMTVEEQVSQLFLLTGMSLNPSELSQLVKTHKPGGYMFRAGNGSDVRQAVRAMQTDSRIPLLIASNLESGGNGIATEGTFFAKQMEVAATGDQEHARRLGEVCGIEGAAVGCNWSFSPVADIDMNWRNPITNVRTFGSCPEQVLAMTKAYLEGLATTGVAPTIKHFPGDGVDERDQHLLPSVNSLSAEDWYSSYGRIYQTLIDLGTPAIMAGHILQPALSKAQSPALREEDILPATLSKELITGILRNDMGFQGLVVTDATPMVGFSAYVSRRIALPLAIAAGCDMLTFTKNTEEDHQAILDGISAGILSEERLYEAVRRILAFKASLGLHEKQVNGTLVPPVSALELLGCPRHCQWAKDCADQAITLVKDTQQLLPLSPERTPRIRLTILGEKNGGGFGDNAGISVALSAALEKAGFQVSLYDEATLEHGEIFHCGVADMKEKFDLSVVAANVENASNHTTRRLDWITLMAANEPWYAKDIPTLFLSFANPYHLVDVPFLQTFVNCYSSNRFCIEACVEKLIGQSEFTGQSPVDPACNIWGAMW